MADTWTVSEFQRRLKALEIDSSLHLPPPPPPDGEETQAEITPKATETIMGYEEALKLLIKDVHHISSDFDDDDKKMSVTKETVAMVVLCVSAHLGVHYWTTSTTRSTAKEVMTKLIHQCGCKTALELLIGRSGSHDSKSPSHADHVTSPYVPMVTRAEETSLSKEAAGECGGGGGGGEGGGEGGKGGKGEEGGGGGGKGEEGKEGGGGGEEGRNPQFANGVIKQMLTLLQSRLTRKKWKKQPTAKHALIWTLRQLKHPHLSPLLHSFLPPLLLLVDDHESYHKVLGLSALSHLIANVDPTELRWYGRADVIYEAIKSMLYVREEEIIRDLHPCLLLLLPVMAGPTPLTITTPQKPTRTDETFRVLLNNLQMESNIALRKAFIAQVAGYIKELGIYTTRHIKQVLGVIDGCLEFPDYCGERTREMALKTLIVLMKNVWPRVSYHSSEILKMLLKLISDLCPHDDIVPNKPEIARQLKLISQCLLTLRHCCAYIDTTYRSLQRDCGHHKGLFYCLETALTGIE